VNCKGDENGTDTILRDPPHAKKRMIRVLVTAFGAFPGAPSNPTLAISRELERRHAKRLARLSIALHTCILPVRFHEVSEALSLALEAARPDVVLHLGLAARRKTMSVELRALNRLGTLRPDAAGVFASSRAVVIGGPAQRMARWPAARVRAAMDRSAATHLSIDAGDYVCNQTLFLTLSTISGQAGFIHVPRPRNGGGRRHPGLGRMVAATASALIVMATAARTGSRATGLDHTGS